MRIISKFHDYYDTALSFGVDTTIQYVREQQEFDFEVDPSIRSAQLPNKWDDLIFPIARHTMKLPHEIPSPAKKGKWHNEVIQMTPKVIGFCGNLIPCFETCNILSMQYPSTISEYVTYFGLHNFVSTCNPLTLERVGTTQEELRNFLYNNKRKYDSHLTFSRWDEYASFFSGKDFNHIFVGLKTPIFLLERRYRIGEFRLTINPMLSKSNLQKIIPPNEAFQFISTYIGNQLVEHFKPEPENVSDKYMIAKKGFDKWSFRKHRDDQK